METETTLLDTLLPILPYISSIVMSIIAGFASYCKARKDAKADMEKLEKQHEFDIEKERERFSMEKEKLEIEHKHQLELLQKQLENSMGTSVVNTFFAEAMKLPEVQQQLSQGMRKAQKKRR